MKTIQITLVVAGLAFHLGAFAQSGKSSDAGPGGTAGGETQNSAANLNNGNLGKSSIGTTTNLTTGNTSGEGPGVVNGHSTNGARMGSTAGMDRSTSTSTNEHRTQRKMKKKHQTTGDSTQ